jgi:hypothetical protein
MPFTRSITGTFFAAVALMTLLSPSPEIAPMITALAPRATQSSICETCLARLV